MKNALLKPKPIMPRLSRSRSCHA